MSNREQMGLIFGEFDEEAGGDGARLGLGVMRGDKDIEGVANRDHV